MLCIMLTVTLPCSDGPPTPLPLMSRDCDDVTDDVIGDADHVVLLPVAHCASTQNTTRMEPHGDV